MNWNVLHVCIFDGDYPRIICLILDNSGNFTTFLTRSDDSQVLIYMVTKMAEDQCLHSKWKTNSKYQTNFAVHCKVLNAQPWQYHMWLITLQLNSPISVATTESSLSFARNKKLEFSNLHNNSSRHWREKKLSGRRYCCLIKCIWFADCCDISLITKWTCGEITIEGYKYLSRVTPPPPTMKCLCC